MATSIQIPSKNHDIVEEDVHSIPILIPINGFEKPNFKMYRLVNFIKGLTEEERKKIILEKGYQNIHPNVTLYQTRLNQLSEPCQKILKVIQLHYRIDNKELLEELQMSN